MAPIVTITIVLGEDILREVFIRLPTAEDLVRVAAVCKTFLHALTNPPFLHHFRCLHPSSCSRLIGCLTIGDSLYYHMDPQFIPSSSSSSNVVWAFKFAYHSGGGWLRDSTWKHLDCRNGRFLFKNWSKRLRVSDPLSRLYVDLPEPPTRNAIGWGLIADDGDSSVFRVVFISRDTTSLDLHAHIISSDDLLSWTEVTGIPCQPDLVGFRAMQANQSLYWKLKGGECMLAFSTVTMEFSLVHLPPSLRQHGFDVIEKGEEDCHVLHLLTINDFCIETWAGTPDGDGGMAWRRVDKSVTFHKSVEELLPYVGDQSELDVVWVVAGVVFVRCLGALFSIDMQTMNLKVLSKKGAWAVQIYPYTIAWPPYFLNPCEQGDFSRYN